MRGAEDNTSHRLNQRPAYCGVASSVMVLNALGSSKRQGYRPLTQDTFFDGHTQSIRSRSYALTE
ncbi:phytochelatin synthase family protein [Microcoleus sp. BROC3]|uniref:phytochelatin synthase family protein n=1 Tax=Microcoleus sp. BROC3 TaxID=3055323 RepID=UPI004040C85B